MAIEPNNGSSTVMNEDETRMQPKIVLRYCNLQRTGEEMRGKAI